MVHTLSGNRGTILVHLPGIADDDLRRWAELENQRVNNSLTVTLTQND